MFILVQLVARLTAVRGALQDHLEDNPVIYTGVAALLDFTAQICRKLKDTVLGAGSGALQALLVQVRLLWKLWVCLNFKPELKLPQRLHAGGRPAYS